MSYKLESQHGILLSFTRYPAIGSLIVAAIMHWYKLDDHKMEQMRIALKNQAKE